VEISIWEIPYVIKVARKREENRSARPRSYNKREGKLGGSPFIELHLQASARKRKKRGKGGE